MTNPNESLRSAEGLGQVRRPSEHTQSGHLTCFGQVNEGHDGVPAHNSTAIETDLDNSVNAARCTACMLWSLEQKMTTNHVVIWEMLLQVCLSLSRTHKTYICIYGGFGFVGGQKADPEAGLTACGFESWTGAAPLSLA